jgi:hypothetical protein
MGHILHDWNLEVKEMLIRKAYEAVPDGGALIVYEAIIDDERRQNAFGLLMSLNMLIETQDGFDYTGADCSGWMKKAGLWAPQSPKEFGGMDLPIVAWAAIYEEAARSIFGPLVFNCMAPDDGNMNLLKLVGTREQKEKWLKPIVEGKVRSSFAMTEPAPGGGSDPSMIKTYAEKRGLVARVRDQPIESVVHRYGPLRRAASATPGSTKMQDLGKIEAAADPGNGNKGPLARR